jgi:hypothetical protein
MVWILIAIVGLVLYMYPPMTMYINEGFYTLPTAARVTKATTAPNTSSISPNAAAGPAPDLDILIRNIENVVKVPTYTPDLEQVPALPAYYGTVSGKSVGAKEQPKEASTTKSQPSNPLNENDVADMSSSLAQGQTFQSTKQTTPPIVERIIEREKIVEVPRQCPECAECKRCPKQRQCPDMRDYIRKDSIPCWGCKLK